MARSSSKRASSAVGTGGRRAVSGLAAGGDAGIAATLPVGSSSTGLARFTLPGGSVSAPGSAAEPARARAGSVSEPTRSVPAGTATVSEPVRATASGAIAFSAPGRVRSRAPHFEQMMTPEASGGVVTSVLHFGHFMRR